MSEVFKADLYDPDYFLEEKDGYVFEVELPGFKKEQVSLSIEKNLLRITAERERRDKKVKANESYVIPSGADSSKIKAVLEDGILTVSFKKTKGSSIKIS
jgi:HSP20 family protein